MSTSKEIGRGSVVFVHCPVVFLPFQFRIAALCLNDRYRLGPHCIQLMPPHWSEKFTGVITMREPSLGLPRSKPGRPKCNLFSNLRANDNPLRSTYLRYVGELSAKFFHAHGRRRYTKDIWHLQVLRLSMENHCRCSPEL